MNPCVLPAEYENIDGDKRWISIVSSNGNAKNMLTISILA